MNSTNFAPTGIALIALVSAACGSSAGGNASGSSWYQKGYDFAVRSLSYQNGEGRNCTVPRLWRSPGVQFPIL
jgi:hypothetical protein